MKLVITTKKNKNTVIFQCVHSSNAETFVFSQWLLQRDILNANIFHLWVQPPVFPIAFSGTKFWIIWNQIYILSTF